MKAYYNEVDPYAVQWLRNLIAAKLITDGEVDDRSILDVRPGDLAGFTRCHFFAGIGVWDYALGLAGWPADRPVWTGSCPCQPFSAAGKGGGFADERHLWPAFFHLIRERRPAKVLGEQVASKDGLGWLDLVQADLEGEGYAVGAADLCAAGVGAPHIRQRLWFVAHADEQHGDGRRCHPGDDCGQQRGSAELRGGQSVLRAMALATEPGSQGGLAAGQRPHPQFEAAERSGATGLLGDAYSAGSQPGQSAAEAARHGRSVIPDGRIGFWSDADWIACRDGKARPVEPGTFPLAHGAPARVGRLRAYGNAIVAEAASAFIGAVMEARP